MDNYVRFKALRSCLFEIFGVETTSDNGFLTTGSSGGSLAKALTFALLDHGELASFYACTHCPLLVCIKEEIDTTHRQNMSLLILNESSFASGVLLDKTNFNMAKPSCNETPITAQSSKDSIAAPRQDTERHSQLVELPKLRIPIVIPGRFRRKIFFLSDELSEESDSPAVGHEPISSPTLTAVANTRVGEISTTKNTILSGAAVFRSALSLTQQHRPSLQPAAPRPRLIIRLPRRVATSSTAGSVADTGSAVCTPYVPLRFRRAHRCAYRALLAQQLLEAFAATRGIKRKRVWGSMPLRRASARILARVQAKEKGRV